jgi:hypothetical protein
VKRYAEDPLGTQERSSHRQMIVDIVDIQGDWIRPPASNIELSSCEPIKRTVTSI